jgi:hypothetical protein
MVNKEIDQSNTPMVRSESRLVYDRSLGEELAAIFGTEDINRWGETIYTAFQKLEAVYCSVGIWSDTNSQDGLVPFIREVVRARQVPEHMKEVLFDIILYEVNRQAFNYELYDVDEPWDRYIVKG